MSIDFATRYGDTKGEANRLPAGTGRAFSRTLLLPAALIAGCLLTIIFMSRNEQVYSSTAGDRLPLSGRIECTETHISTAMPARVKSVAVEEGDNVHKGQVLITFDSPTLLSKLDDAQSNLILAREVRRQAAFTVKTLEDQAQRAHNAQAGLVGHLVGGLGKSKAKIDELSYQLTSAESQLHSAQEGVARAQALVDETHATMAYLKVTSPIDGQCVTRSIEPGEIAAPGQILLTLINPKDAYLKGFIPEGSIGRVRVGQTAQVFLDGIPDRPLKARVVSIDSQAAFTPENIYFKQDRVKEVFGVKLAITRPDGFAKAGMPADAQIVLVDKEQ